MPRTPLFTRLQSLRSADWSLLIAALIPCGLSLVFRVAGAAPQELDDIPVRPALVFDQYLIDLGEIPSEPYAIARYRFTNRGSETIHVKSLEPSCGCLQPRLERREYAPGESGDFVLRVQTAGEPIGQREYFVRVHYEDPQPREVELTFRLSLPERKVEVLPKALVFYQLNGQPSTQDVTIRDYRERPLTVLSADCDSPFVNVDLRTVQTNSEGVTEAVISVLVAGKIPPGRQRALIVARTSDPQYPAIPVPLILEGPPESESSRTGAAVSPAQLQLVHSALEEAPESQIRVTLPAEDPTLSVIRVVSASGLVQPQLLGGTRADDGTRQVIVEVKLQGLVKSTAAQRDLIVLTFSDGSTREVPVTIAPAAATETR